MRVRQAAGEGPTTFAGAVKRRAGAHVMNRWRGGSLMYHKLNRNEDPGEIAQA